MNEDWKSIRLQLARTENSEGALDRGYIVRLPLDENGFIAEDELCRLPAAAKVYRFSPDEPERSGYVVRTDGGWAFSYQVGETDDEAIFHLETHPIRIGEYLTVTEPDGRQLPYRIGSVAAAA